MLQVATTAAMNGIKKHKGGFTARKGSKMSIYKVYSRACRSSRPVQEITEEKLKEEIEGIIFDDFMNECDTSFLNDEEGEISDESFNLLASALCELLESVWNKDGILERGDYAIIKAEESPSRSCMYGRTYTDFTQKEIIEKMEELKNNEKI